MKEDGIRRSLTAIGLPDDLPEVALTPSPTWSEHKTQRIANRIQARLAPRATKTTWRMRLTAATILLLVALAGYGAVSAGWQQLLTFIPGIGIRPLEEHALMLPQPVTVEAGGWRLEVSGVQAGAESTIVNVRVTPPSRAEHKITGSRLGSQVERPALLVGDQVLTAWHWSVAHGRDLVARVSFPPLTADTRQIALSIPNGLGPSWNVPMELEPAQEQDLFWHSHQLAGTVVGLGVLVAAEEAVVTVQAPLDGERSLTQLGFSALGFSECQQALMGMGGQPAEFHPAVPRRELNLPVRLVVDQELIAPSWCDRYIQGQFRYLEYRFPLDPAKTGPLALSIPAVVMEEAVTTECKITVPASGNQELNQTVLWGEHTLLLTRVERTERTVRIDIGWPGDALYPLVGLDIRAVAPQGVRGCSYVTCRESGEVMYLEFPVTGELEVLHLELSHPRWLMRENHYIELGP